MKEVFLVLKRNISAYLRRNKYMLLIVFTALCTGVVAGAYGAMRGGVAEIVPIDGLTQKGIITASFLENLKFLTWIGLWGVNALGFPVIIYLLYSKGAMLSASVYALFTIGNSNQLMLVISVLPYIMCTVASVMVISHGSLCYSLQLAKNVMIRRNTRNLPNISRLAAEFALAAIFALLGGVCEAVFKVNIT